MNQLLIIITRASIFEYILGARILIPFLLKTSVECCRICSHVRLHIDFCWFGTDFLMAPYEQVLC